MPKSPSGDLAVIACAGSGDPRQPGDPRAHRPPETRGDSPETRAQPGDPATQPGDPHTAQRGRLGSPDLAVLLTVGLQTVRRSLFSPLQGVKDDVICICCIG